MFHEISSTFVRLVLMAIRRQLIHGSAQGFFLWTNPQKKMYWNMKRMKEKMGETNEECEKMMEEKSNTRMHDTWMVSRVRHHYLDMRGHTRKCDVWRRSDHYTHSWGATKFMLCITDKKKDWHGVLHNDNSKWMTKRHGTTEFNFEM